MSAISQDVDAPVSLTKHAAHAPYYEFKPINLGRWIVWSVFAFVLAIAPMVFTSSLSHSMLSQMGVAIIVCLSYNMLLGQGVMLSFGHAVYSGMVAFITLFGSYYLR